MTLPSTNNIPTVNFNNFDAMASISLDDPMRMVAFQQQSVQSTADEDQPVKPINNNESGNIVQPIMSSNNASSIPWESGIAAAAAAAISHDLAVESVMPGIYFTNNFTEWNEQNLRSHGFTHVIIIDKHIKELYYPSPVFKLSMLSKNSELYEPSSPFDYFCSAPVPPAASLNFSKDFEAIDLNFGEKSYLTTVLPNCYLAVRFINKALQSGGTILVIDCNGGEQKCLTIIVAYLMYKYNDSFSNAFARLKEYYKNADLDRFYMSQLYEYEPILQVQRSQSRGHSCSREMHSAILKRKNVDEDFSVRFEDCDAAGANVARNNFNRNIGNDGDDCIFGVATVSGKLLQTFNPLSKFNATIAEKNQTQEMQKQNNNETRHAINQQMAEYVNQDSYEYYTKADIVNSLHNANWDDFTME